MSTPPLNGDRVTNRQLYEELAKIPTRFELRITVFTALVLGQLAARVELERFPVAPASWALHVLHLVVNVF
jgi:hypothetical protein